jgi:hypothetical protein
VDRKEIERILKLGARGSEVICRQEVKDVFGWGNSKADQMLRGLTGIRSAKKKYYSIREVATNISKYIN